LLDYKGFYTPKAAGSGQIRWDRRESAISRLLLRFVS